MSQLVDKIRQHLQHPRYRRAHRYFSWHLYDHFVPNDRNNYQPFIVHHRALALFSALLVLLKLVVIVAPSFYPAEPLYSSAITVQNIVELTNVSRQGFGLSPLAMNPYLTKAAEQKANDMALSGYFAHTSPQGIDPWYWIKQAGYKYSYAGENLAMKFQTAEGVTNAWMASPSHKANILKSEYREIGVGIKEGVINNEKVVLVVQMFGTSAIASAVTEVPATEVPSLPPFQETKPPPQETVTPPPETVIPLEPPEPAEVEQPAVVYHLPKAAPPDAALMLNSFTLRPFSSSPFDYQLGLKTNQQVTSVTMAIGKEAVGLKPISPPDSEVKEWSGSIVLSEQQIQSVVPVNVYWRDQSNKQQTNRLANFGLTPVQGIYEFSGTALSALRPVSVWGGLVDLTHLPAVVNAFYIYFAIFLFLAWITNIAIKPEVQHLDLITHSALVIILAMALWFV
ncbi:MAG: CAP domain-containing protein [Patescibacteria group bacterium]